MPTLEKYAVTNVKHSKYWCFAIYPSMLMSAIAQQLIVLHCPPAGAWARARPSSFSLGCRHCLPSNLIVVRHGFGSILIALFNLRLFRILPDESPPPPRFTFQNRAERGLGGSRFCMRLIALRAPIFATWAAPMMHPATTSRHGPGCQRSSCLGASLDSCGCRLHVCRSWSWSIGCKLPRHIFVLDDCRSCSLQWHHHKCRTSAMLM